MTKHIPILEEPIVDALLEPFRKNIASEPWTEGWIIDCTFGGGGHSRALFKRAEEENLTKLKILGIDQDPFAIERGTVSFSKEIKEGRLELFHGKFGSLGEELLSNPVLGIIADLGISSDQIDEANRGFSFMADGPLDMRMNPRDGLSCFEYLKTVDEEILANVLWKYGEERFSRRIASSIIDSRARGQLPKTTKELVQLVVRAVPKAKRHGRMHVATRSFQGLRIAVNQELQELDYLLDRVILSLSRGGRVAIMSFHSLEDRRVKKVLNSKNGVFKPLQKKPLIAQAIELSRNPRARSAKLRISERL